MNEHPCSLEKLGEISRRPEGGELSDATLSRAPVEVGSEPCA